MKKIITILILGVIFVSCKDVIDKKLSKSSFNDDVEDIKGKHKDEYTAEDFKELTEKGGNKIVSQMMGINVDENITYKTILEDIKKERIKNEKIIKTYKDALSKLNNAVSFKIDSTQYLKGPKGEAFIYKIEVQNKTNKNLLFFEGKFKIYSPTNEIVKEIIIKGGEEIKAKKTLTAATYDLIYDWDKPEELARLKHNELKIVWEPEYLTFEGGDKMTAPTKPYTDN